MKLGADGVNAYANDLVKLKIISSAKLRMIDMAIPLYAKLTAYVGHNSLEKELNHDEERIVSAYLLSCDFFRIGQNQGRLVRYVEFYKPIKKIQPSQTPFARPVTYS